MRGYDALVEAVAAMPGQPFGRQDLLRWVAEHHPDVERSEVSAQLPVVTSNGPEESRALLGGRAPLVTRVGRGQFVRYLDGRRRADVTAPVEPSVERSVPQIEPAHRGGVEPAGSSGPADPAEPGEAYDDSPPPRLMVATTTIWTSLEQCVDLLRHPFSGDEVVSWFRRHRPEVDEGSLRAHLRGATSNATEAERGLFADREPLISRLADGRFIRYPTWDAPPPQPPTSSPASLEGAPTPTATPAPAPPPRIPLPAAEPSSEREVSDVGSVLATRLSAVGWRVTDRLGVPEESDVDLLAEQQGRILAVTLADYPPYPGPRRGGQRRPLSPGSAEAPFAAALLAAMRIRHRQPEWLCAIGLPALRRYRRLAEETRSSLSRAGIHLLWVDESGRLSEEAPEPASAESLDALG